MNTQQARRNRFRPNRTNRLTIKPPIDNTQQTPASRPAVGSAVPSMSGHDSLLEQIRRSRSKTENHARRLRRASSVYTYTSVTCSSLATLVAGWAAALGPMVGEGPIAWKFTCGIVAIFTATATLLNGMQQGTRLSDRVSKAVACAGGLSALEVALTVTGRDIPEVSKEYEALVAQHQDLLL
jgi:hypothetical protein